MSEKNPKDKLDQETTSHEGDLSSPSRDSGEIKAIEKTAQQINDLLPEDDSYLAPRKPTPVLTTVRQERKERVGNVNEASRQ